MLSPEAKRGFGALANAPGAAWIASVRWGLPATSLPDRPRFNTDDAMYELSFLSSLRLLAEWQLSNEDAQLEWQHKRLTNLLEKLLAACPSFPAFTELLHVTWAFGPADEMGKVTGSILSLRSDESIPAKVRRNLDQVVQTEAKRVLNTLELAMLPEAYHTHTELHDAVRAAAANTDMWKCQTTQVLDIITHLEFT